MQLRSILVFFFAAAFCCGDDDYAPEVAGPSKDAQLALQGFILPDGMSGSLLAAEPALANPVAFHIANDGRVFVCETFRQEVGVEDNRSHMDWLENDLRLQSVEERLAMFRRYLGADVLKYATEHDRIRVLSDTNGDGRLDSDLVYAQGFNGILDGTGAGVIEHDGKVYYTCIPKLWMLEDTNDDGTADATEALHHGYGVRVAFRGHDMHGLTIGPDGRLYFSIGDRGFNVITREGTRLKHVDNGAVFRCDMDGNHLEVFAYGLRNPQELAFDDFGNLWTGDNNSDGGDKARWVYVVQDGDTGWRMYYQYLNDRGPWSRERMWYPYRADEETTAVQPAYIVPPVAHLGNGPSGLTYYPGLGLSDRYKNHFFMADFRGGASNSGIRSFSVKPKGAGFELTDSHEFIWSILGTDVDFAPDGSLYVTDWVNGWVGEGKGRLYRFADNDYISAVEGANVASLLRTGIAKASANELFAILSHADRRVRQQAQFEIVKRVPMETVLKRWDSPEQGELSKRHIAWALWQFGLKSVEDARKVVEVCAKVVSAGVSGETTVQYTKVLADLVRRHEISTVMSDKIRDGLRNALTRNAKLEEPRLAGFSAVTLGAIGRAADVESLFDLLDRNNNEDAVLRHQAIMGLANIGARIPGSLLTDNIVKRSPAVRLGLAVVLRRLKREEIVQLLDDGDQSVAAEAARAVCEHGTDAALNVLSFPLLFNTAHPKAVTHPPFVRRALEACYRLGNKRHALVVARVAGDEKRPDDIRLVAVEMLTSWNDPQQTDSVSGKWRPIKKRELEGLDEAVSKDLPGMLAGPPEVSKEAIKLAAQLKITNVVPTLEEMFADDQAEDAIRVAAFKALARMTDKVETLLTDGLADRSDAIKIAALELLADRSPDDAVPALAEAVNSSSVKAQQAALAMLGKIGSEGAVAVLTEQFSLYDKGKLPKAIILDLVKASQSTGNSILTARVDAIRAKQTENITDPSAWMDCLEGGDLQRGIDVFFGRAAASCRRCHKVNGNGADVGPDLSSIAKGKDRKYLLESLVNPNAKIATGFETTIVVDINGLTHVGIIKQENDEVVRLMTPKGALITVAKADIEERVKGKSGMPVDLIRNLSRDDVRDLVEFLSTLKVAEDSAHGKSDE